MAQQLSDASQEAALDFMIEAKKADECFLAACLNSNQAVANVDHAVNEQAVGPAELAQITGRPSLTNCSMLVIAPNYEPSSACAIGDVASMAGFEAPPISESADILGAGGISLDVLIKLRHALREKSSHHALFFTLQSPRRL